MSVLAVTGFDPSLRHWGVAQGYYDTQTHAIEITHLAVIEPVITKGKTIRVNSKDLAAAVQLAEAVRGYVQGQQAIFVEMPSGTQNARGAAAYGVCVGVLGALRATGKVFTELTPTQVKLVTGNKNATKKEMISWACEKYPQANWPSYQRAGSRIISEAKAEHMADAVAAIHAGVTGDIFKQLLLFNSQQTATI